MTPALARFRDRGAQVTVHGISEDYFDPRNLILESGVGFDQQAVAAQAQVAAKAEQTAMHSFDLVRRQARSGEVDQLTALNAEQACLQTSIVRVIAEATRLSDSAAWFTALGGGVVKRTEPKRKDSKPASLRTDYALSRDFASNSRRLHGRGAIHKIYLPWVHTSL